MTKNPGHGDGLRFPTVEDVAENFRKLARALRGETVRLSEPSGYVIEHLERR